MYSRIKHQGYGIKSFLSELGSQLTDKACQLPVNLNLNWKAKSMSGCIVNPTKGALLSRQSSGASWP